MKMSLPDNGMYCIIGEEFSMGRSNVFVAKELIKAGVRIIQYREKEKKSLSKFYECIEIREITRDAGVTFIINDDIDIAMLIDADGVHVGQDDLPISEVRKLLGTGKIIGVSTHSPEQAEAAVLQGADYIGVGPIYKTFTKKDVCAPVGLEYLQHVTSNHSIPHVAIGGIKMHNLDDVLDAGAKCVCMVTEILGAKNIASAIDAFADKMRAVNKTL